MTGGNSGGTLSLRRSGCQPSKSARQIRGQLPCAQLWPELLRIDKHLAKPRHNLWLQQLLMKNLMRDARPTGEVSVDLDAPTIAHYQKRWVLQRQGVLHELLQGLPEVLVRALVFPGEASPLPHVGIQLTTGDALKSLFETVAVVFVAGG